MRMVVPVLGLLLGFGSAACGEETHLADPAKDVANVQETTSPVTTAPTIDPGPPRKLSTAEVRRMEEDMAAQRAANSRKKFKD